MSKEAQPPWIVDVAILAALICLGVVVAFRVGLAIPAHPVIRIVVGLICGAVAVVVCTSQTTSTGLNVCYSILNDLFQGRHEDPFHSTSVAVLALIASIVSAVLFNPVFFWITAVVVGLVLIPLANVLDHDWD